MSIKFSPLICLHQFSAQMAGPKGAKANLQLIEGEGAKFTLQIQVGRNFLGKFLVEIVENS